MADLSPGQKLAEAVRLVKRARDQFQQEVIRTRVELRAAANVLDAVVGLIETSALPPRPEEGETLLVAWDYLCSRGGLPESARAVLTAAVRHHPEALAPLLFAVWQAGEPGADLELLSLSQDRWLEPLGEVWKESDRWFWFASGRRGDELWQEQAQAAVERVCSDWCVLRGVRQVRPAPGTETAPTDGGHQWSGDGLQACTNRGCRRWRLDGRYVFADDPIQARARFNYVEQSNDVPGTCPGTIPEGQRCLLCRGCGLVRQHWDALIETCPRCTGTGRS